MCICVHNQIYLINNNNTENKNKLKQLIQI